MPIEVLAVTAEKKFEVLFSTTIPSLGQYRKQMKHNYIFTYPN